MKIFSGECLNMQNKFKLKDIFQERILWGSMFLQGSAELRAGDTLDRMLVHHRDTFSVQGLDTPAHQLHIL